jgi:ABC-type polysaccharide/polyol phosphate transport system ATPase subunit
MAGGTEPQKPLAVSVEGVSKAFAIPRERSHTLKERALHPFRRAGSERLQALDDVSFEVPRGEFFGIVGRNGSGKSTLLKCLAGIYATDEGQMSMAGRLSTFIELGVGFNPDLAARDNIVMNAIMLGLPPAEARARVDRVIEFAELEEFTDLKLKNYSSGMNVRLAFAVMIQVDADVLLIDEILAVGDAAFQQKCFDVFNRLRDDGKTILFVTHDMGAVERFCHRAMLLERGEIVEIGKPRAVAARYLELNFGRELERARDGLELPDRAGDGRARVIEEWVENHEGERKNVVMQGERCTFKARVRFNETVEDPSFAVSWVNEFHQNHFVAKTALEQERTGRFAAGEEVVFSVAFKNVLAPGRYDLSVLIAHRGSGTDIIDRWERQISVVVVATNASGGLVDLPNETRVERIPSTASAEPVQVLPS